MKSVIVADLGGFLYRGLWQFCGIDHEVFVKKIGVITQKAQGGNLTMLFCLMAFGRLKFLIEK
jgi:hypothetical protein